MDGTRVQCVQGGEETNFSSSSSSSYSPAQKRKRENVASSTNSTPVRSRFVGVFALKGTSTKPGWVARLKAERKLLQLGPFQTEEEAARAYDDVAGSLNRPVNFPAPESNQRQATKESASKYIGVCWHKPSSKYTASITIEKKNVHLGYFTNEVEAAQRYDEKAGPLGRKVNFTETAPAPELRGDFLKKSLVADQHGRRSAMLARHASELTELESEHAEERSPAGFEKSPFVVGERLRYSSSQAIRPSLAAALDGPAAAPSLFGAEGIFPPPPNNGPSSVAPYYPPYQHQQPLLHPAMFPEPAPSSADMGLPLGTLPPPIIPLGPLAPQIVALGPHAPQIVTLGPMSPPVVTLGPLSPPVVLLGPLPPQGLPMGPQPPGALLENTPWVNFGV